MTAKRFMVDDCGTLIDMQTRDMFDIVEEVVDLLNELHEENLIKLEIVDAFIQGLEDEKGIDSENVEFQCKMNFALKVLNKLKKDMLDPTDFKRVKGLLE